MKEILISGYYGFKNSGDDALLASIIAELRRIKGDEKIVVLSKNPEETKRLYGADAINRTNIFQIVAHMIKARLLISGGGTLMQDATSTKSLLYYLGIIKIAKLFGVKVMLYANGMGPIVNEKNKKITKRVLNKVDVITLRDEKSYEVLKEIGVTEPKIEITADPAFLTEMSDKEKGREILLKAGAPSDKKYLGISIRDWRGSSDYFEEELAKSVRKICDDFDLFPVFLPMQPKDTSISERVAKKIGTDFVILKENIGVCDMLAVTENLYMGVGMRLHMLIYCACCAVPVIGIVYDPKIDGFMDYAGQDKYVFASSFDSKSFCDNGEYIINNYEKVKENLSKTRKLMKERAAKNGIFASLLLREENNG